jgi:hypothetical protein
MKEDQNYKSEDPIDISFLPNKNELSILTSPIEIFLQEIFLAVQSGSEAIWGIPDSLNIYRYLFNKHVTLSTIKGEITNYVQKHCSQAHNFNWNVSAEFINVEGNDLIYINFKIMVPNVIGGMEEILQKFVLGS